MIRHPDSCRRLIIGEDTDGSAVGVMCLNSTIDVDLLNENFELIPYNGLKKLLENDDIAEATGSPSNASRLADLPSIPDYFDIYSQLKTTDVMFRSSNRKL